MAEGTCDEVSLKKFTCDMYSVGSMLNGPLVPDVRKKDKKSKKAS
jgi:hypothetical protein